MTDFTLNLVDAIISGRATDIESAFQEAIKDKISIAMEDKRNYMAQSMFKESADAYELHDPKHPHFVKNHTKWKKSNPNGTTSEFISHMKTKRFNVDEELTLEDYSLEEIEDFMMSEEFEQLDELSTNLVGKYLDKALYKSSTIRHGDGTVTEPTPQTAQRKAGKQLAAGKLGWTADGATAKIKAVPSWKIQFNKDQAKKNLTKEELTLEDYSLEEIEDFMMSEEFEQLDELSKATLGSYVKKAGSYNINKSLSAGDNLASGRREKAIDMRDDISKREKGIGKAVDRLTK